MGIREAIALALAAVLFASGWYMGALSGRLGKANAAQKMATEQLDKIIKEQGADREDRKKLQKTLDGLPKSEGKVREVVRQNPAKCARPAAVADSVQAAIDSSNTARKVSGNP